MSGNTIGSIIGGGIGFLVGGPAGAKWGFMIGGAIGGYVDPVKIQGPRLSDATRQTSQEGIPIPWGYGTFPTAGNIIFAGPLVEHEHKEGGKGGPQTISYTYTRSYAIGICEGPIGGIQKIKRNGKLVYDISPTSTITAENAKFLEKCTIYLGDETQLVDPTIEAIVGVGNTGPYRGLAYIVLEDDDLTETQGAISQYEFVVNVCGTVTTSGGNYIESTGPDFYYPLQSDAVDVMGANPDLTPIGKVTAPITPPPSPGGVGYYFEQYQRLQSTGSANLATVAPGYAVMTKAQIDSIIPASGSVFRNIDGCYSNAITGDCWWALQLRGPDLMTPCVVFGNQVGSGTVLLAPFEVAYGQTFAPGFRYDGTTGLLELLFNGGSVASTTIAPGFAMGGDAQYVNGLSSGVNWQDHGFFGSVGHTIGWNSAISDGVALLSSAQLGVLPAGAYEVPDVPGAIVDQDGNMLTEAVTSESITECSAVLSEIFDDLCDRSGIDVATEVESSQLTDVVKGFKCATESGADAYIEALTMSHFFDRGEWDKKVRGIKRGGANLFALTADDLVARDGPAIDWTMIQEPELLRKVNVMSIDPAADYNMTKQSWERRAGTIRAKGEASVELPEVIATDTAAQIAEIRGKIAWSENAKAKFGLSVKWSKLTPTDPGTFTDKNGLVHRIRLADLNEELGVFSVEEAPKDRAAIYTGTVTGVTNTNTPGTTTPGVVGPTLFVAMNLPQMRSQDGPGLYVGMAGILPGWHGAQLLMSVDGGVSYQPVLTIQNPTIMGPLTDDLDASGTYSILLGVQVYGGALSSATTAQVAQGVNYSAVLTGTDAEVLAYETATETSPGFYDLTTLSRALKGTAADDHVTGDMFMDMSTAYFVPIDPAYSGQTLYFKAVGLGVSADAVPAVTVVYDPAEVIIDGGEIT